MEMKRLRSVPSRNEQSLSRFDRRNQNESFFQKHRSLFILVTVWIFLAPIAFFLSLVLSQWIVSFSSDQTTGNSTCIRKRVIGYYTGALEVNTEQLQNLTHIIFAHLKLDKETNLKFESETFRERFLEMKKKAREMNKELKVMVSIGGWDQSQEFPIFFNKKLYRDNLMDSILSLVKEHQIDGVEIFWIHVDPSDKEKYLEFVQKLRKRLMNFRKETSRASDMLISIATSPLESDLHDKYLWKELMEEVDFINVQTYEYFNSKNYTLIGPTAPIYGGNRENLDFTMKYITCKTGSPENLNLVVPFYGLYWTNVTSPFSQNIFVWVLPMRYENNTALYQSEREKQRVKYRNLNEFRMKWAGGGHHFHNESKTSYYWIPESKTFITIENEQSLRDKVKYQNQMDIGGIGIMTIEEDDDKNTLLNVIAAGEEQCSTRLDNKVMPDCKQFENLSFSTSFVINLLVPLIIFLFFINY